jgi:hypothetical protein
MQTPSTVSGSDAGGGGTEAASCEHRLKRARHAMPFEKMTTELLILRINIVLVRF